MNYKEWISRRLGQSKGRAELKFGGIYLFDVRRQLPPVMIVTRAYTHAIYGFDLSKMSNNLRRAVMSEYKKAMAETNELRRNGKLFNIERRLKNYRVSKDSVVSYKTRDILSRVVELTPTEIDEFIRMSK